MKKFICLLLSLVFLLTLFGCKKSSDNGDNPNNTGESETGNGTAFSTVRKQDYSGKEFKLLYRDGADEYAKADFISESMNGSILNDRIWERNNLVSETYNIKLTILTEADVGGDVTTAIRTNNLSGGSEYDAYSHKRDVIPLSNEGLLYDLNKLEDIDTTQEWWDQDYVKSMTINDSIYTLIGDFSISSLRQASVLCFNKQLFTDLNLEAPYQAVRDGKWTYEKLLTYITDYSSDLDSNNKMDTEDQYGLVGWGVEASYSIFYGSGFSVSKINNDKQLDINYSKEDAENIYTQIYRIWSIEQNYINMTSKVEQHSYPFDIFKDNRALFCDTTLRKVGTMLSDMEAQYGIVPQPKYSEDQDRYYSYTAYTIPLVCVPAVVNDPAMVGNLIEAYCAASYDIVTPDIFEIVTKYQEAHDPDSSEMIDIVIRTKTFDPAHWFYLNGYHNFSRQLLTADMVNTSSYLKSQTNGADKQVNTINAAYKK